MGMCSYVLDTILQSNKDGLPNLKPRSLAGIYIGYPSFHTGSVALVLNPDNGQLWPQFYLLFDDEFSTVRFMRKGTIPQNCKDLVQHISQSSTPDNIDLADNWFNPYIYGDTRKNPRHDMSVTPENNHKTIMLPQSKLKIQESPDIKG